MNKTTLPIQATNRKDQPMTKSRLWLKRDAVREFVKALPAPRYDIRCIANKGDEGAGRPIKQVYKHPSVTGSPVIRFLTAHNDGAPWKGDKGERQPKRNIYIRPVDSSVIRVDDVSEDAIDQMMADGLPFSFVVETSPDNYQVWFKLAHGRDGVSEEEATIVLQFLTDVYEGDHAAATRNAVGRAPGFYNRKEIHAQPNGHGPLVLMRRKKDCRGSWSRERFEQVLALAKSHPANSRARSTPAAQRCDLSFADMNAIIPSLSTDEAIEIYESAIANRDALFGDVDTGDRSNCDYKVVVDLFHHGFNPEDAAAVLMHASDKAHERGEQYVAQTVSSAWSSYLNRYLHRAA